MLYPNAGGDCVSASLAGILPRHLFRWASFERNQHKEMKGKGKGLAAIGHQVLGRKEIVCRELGLCVN